jgi:hypothetical protein
MLRLTSWYDRCGDLSDGRGKDISRMDADRDAPAAGLLVLSGIVAQRNRRNRTLQPLADRGLPGRIRKIQGE